MGRRGRPITASKDRGRKPKRISFALPDEVYRPLAHYVIDADTTIQAFVLAAIREKLARVAGA
jgi:hypothetical protein